MISRRAAAGHADRDTCLRTLVLTSANPNLYPDDRRKPGMGGGEWQGGVAGGGWHPLRQIWVKQWQTLAVKHVGGPVERSGASRLQTPSHVSRFRGHAAFALASFPLKTPKMLFPPPGSPLWVGPVGPGGSPLRRAGPHWIHGSGTLNPLGGASGRDISIKVYGGC